MNDFPSTTGVSPRLRLRNRPPRRSGLAVGWLHSLAFAISLITTRPGAAESNPLTNATPQAAGTGSVGQAEAQSPVKSAAFPFQQVGPGLFSLGQVTLNKAQRSVTFPAVVNQRAGVVEYAVVTRTGKTHESVFRTEAEPEHIHMALLLLGAKPASTSAFASDPATPPPGENVWIDLSWTQVGQEQRRPLEDFVVTTNNQQSLPRGPWVFNGSYVLDSRFLAQDEGSIVAVHVDPAALINSPRPGRENDDLNHVNTSILPPDNESLRMTIRLESRSASLNPPPLATSPDPILGAVAAPRQARTP